MKDALLSKAPRIMAAGVLGAASYYIGKRESYLYYYTTMFLCPFSVLYILYQLKEILKEVSAVRKLFGRLARFLLPLTLRLKKLWAAFARALSAAAQNSVLYKKIEYLHLKDLSCITGYSDEYIPINNEIEKNDYDFIRLKWKRCKTNAERVRYLYAKYVLEKRKSGHAFRCSDTPMQIQSKWGKDQYNQTLFPEYYRARYAPKEKIGDEEVEALLVLQKKVKSKGQNELDKQKLTNL